MESNHQPADYKSAALPVEPHQRGFFIKFWCLGAESNHRHEDFQSSALPTELPRHIAFSSDFIKISGDPEGTRTLDLRRDRAAF